MREEGYKLRTGYFKALAYPTRVKIIDFLKKGEKSVGEISWQLKIKQANISQHLAILRKAGIVTEKREGKIVYYRIKDRRVFEVLQLIDHIMHRGSREHTKVLRSR